MREATDVLDAEFLAVTGRRARDVFASLADEESSPETWGEGPEAEAGLDAALSLGIPAA